MADSSIPLSDSSHESSLPLPSETRISNALSRNSVDAYSSSPYYIHHSDSLGAVIVSKVLTGDNYYNWSRAMRMALNAKKKLAFIDGSLPRPATHSVMFSEWDRANDMVTSWLLNAVSGEISDSINNGVSAHNVWIELRERFSQSSRIFELTSSIATSQQDNLSICAYYSKLKPFWDELSSISMVGPCTCAPSKSAASL
ncbi:uncharacterized protein LOC143849422 [Tasmannia lanceolata]|uniref:uncharacterized protein LOC143849422 n=1 Tax=Tasmannia lanceolata TaxID=3420 RepID=UPI0040636A03